MKKILLTATLTGVLFGYEFHPIGFRAIGMGGAGVANASGSMSAYYNPALLAQHKYSFETGVDVGIGIREMNLINPIDKLANTYDLTGAIDKIGDNAPNSGTNDPDTIENIKGSLTEIYKLSNGNGFQLEPTAGFGMQMGNFALGAYASAEIASNAVIDRNHLYLIFKDEDNGGYFYYYPDTDTYGATDKKTYEKYSLQYALDNNLTYININGIGLAEVPVSYATNIDLRGATLSVGVNLKYMQGITYKSLLSLGSDSDELGNSLTDNSKTTSTFGIDMGILVSSDAVKVGLVGKNLNAPEFDYYDGTKYKLEPMFRGGVAIDFTNWLTFAMDIDLTRNKTSIPDYKSQYIGGGIDFHQSWFSIRAGAMRNMLQDEEGTILTAGFGFGLKWLQLDVAAEASTKTGTYDGNEIPRYAKVNIAILSRWGGN
jgi:hypothetical protein